MTPLWFAGTTEAAVRRAGRDGDGLVLLGFYTPLEERRQIVELYRAEAHAAGREPVVVQLLDGFVADTYAEAKETFGPLWVDEIAYYLKWGMIEYTEEIASIGDATFERLEKYMVVGDADTAAQSLARFRDGMGLGEDDWIILRSRLPEGPGFEAALDSIRRFGENVIPMLQG